MGLQDIIRQQAQAQLDREKREQEARRNAEKARRKARRKAEEARRKAEEARWNAEEARQNAEESAAQREKEPVAPHLLKGKYDSIMDDYVVAQILLSRVVPAADNGFMLCRFARSLDISPTKLNELEQRASKMNDAEQAALINRVVESLGDFSVQSIFVFDFLKIHGERYILNDGFRELWSQVCLGILKLRNEIVGQFEPYCADVASGWMAMSSTVCKNNLGIPEAVLKYYLKDDKNAPQYVSIDVSSGTSAKMYPVAFHRAVEPSCFAKDEKTIWLRRIQAGTFIMGDIAKHKVVLTRDFYMGIFPVTQLQWTLVMGNNPSL